MLHLLNLLAAIALLLWGTRIVRTGVLRVYGGSLRKVLSTSMQRRPAALLAGLGVTALVQSATATCMIVANFVGQGMVGTSAALVVVLGADMGSALMAVVFSADMSWVSPLLILVGVVVHLSRDKSKAGRLGQVVIGLGLIMLALHLIVESTRPMTASPAVRALIASLPQEIMVELLVGALLTMMSYSSLAVILLVAALASQGLVTPEVALGFVLGANLGSGLLAVVSTSGADVVTRRLPVGNLLFKLAGVLLMLPALPWLLPLLQQHVPTVQQQIVLFHLGFNVAMALLFVGLAGPLGRLLDRVMKEPDRSLASRPRHLDASALSMPSVAISCAAREALHQADVVETMLGGVITVIRENELGVAEQLRRMDDQVDDLYSSIKFYLTQISREALDERESRRWTDIVSFTIHMEQIGDIVERVILDIEDKKIRQSRTFSDAGMAEIAHLHERLMSNLRLSMSVFLDGHVRDAQRLLEEKARFRDLERQYAANHIARLQSNSTQSIETSSLHLDLQGEFKRINSLICSTAYPVLDLAGVLHRTGAARPIEQLAPQA